MPVVTWYVKGAWSTEIVSGPLTTADADLASLVTEAQSRHFQVVLALHIDSLDGAWRGFIDPKDKAAWFASYRQILNHYAEFAEEQNIDGIVIGAELVQLTRPAYTEAWQSLIVDVRQRFRGFLTYSAQWGSGDPDTKNDPLEEYNQIGFWSDLDYLGISAYFNLASPWVKPGTEQLRQTWGQWQAKKIEPFQAKHDKPLLFTEVGYKSTAGAAARPWDPALHTTIDPELQADLYAVLFEAWHDVPWFQGVYFWYWSPKSDAGGGTDADYTPQNKPAENVIREWYGRFEVGE